MRKAIRALACAAVALTGSAQAQTQAQTTTQELDGPIVVTATKRETDLQQAAVAVSVVSADTVRLESIRDIAGLSGLVPSLRVATFANTINTNFIVRGFGNGAFGPGIEPSIGVFVDGVYRSRAGSAVADLPEIERIEVLKGPQSTLFGKNASAGVISIVTREPEFSPEVWAEATVGNRRMRAFKAGVTGPLSERIAVSLDASRRVSDGFGTIPNLRRDINDRNRWGLRGQALYVPNDAVRFRLIADYEHVDEQCCLVTNVVDGPAGAIVRVLGGGYPANAPFSYAMPADALAPNRVTNYGLSLQGDVDLGGSKVTAITAWRRGRHVYDQDADFTGADLLARNLQDRDTRTFTQELRWTGKLDDRVGLLAGAFFMDERVRQTGAVTLGGDFRAYADALVRAQTGGQLSAAVLEALAGQPGRFWLAGQGSDEAFRLRNRSGSLFADADVALAPRLTLKLGAAWILDRKRSSARVTSTEAFSAVDLIALGRDAIVASAVGSALGLGRSASAQEVRQFASAQPAAYATVGTFAATNAGLTPQEAAADGNAATTIGNALLALRQLQFLPPFLAYPNAVESGRTRDHRPTWSLRLAYEARPGLDAYVAWSTGFKATSINLSRDSRPSPADFVAGSPAQLPLAAASPIRDAGLALVNLTSGTRFAEPEKVRLAEAGLRWRGKRASAALTLFDQRIRDFQTTLFVGNGFVLGNAGRQSTRGAELEASVAPFVWLRIDAALAWLDARYDRYPNAQVAGGVPQDYSGRRVAGVSRFTGSLGATAAWPVAAGMVLVHARYGYESPVIVRNDMPDITRRVDELRGSLTWRSGRGFEISLWGQNLLDAHWLVQAFPGVLQPGTISGYPNEPRSYGVTFRFEG